MRRLGVILACGFIEACLVAIPLSWGRWSRVSVHGRDWEAVDHGQVYFGAGTYAAS